MGEHPELRRAFSVSSTSRPPRGAERDGVEYFFVSPGEFRRKIENDEFIEYEEVYKDRFYGTLRAQVEKQLARGENVVLDVDVAGGCRIKERYGEQALLLFVMPPSLQELRRRLEQRGTDSPAVIEDRLAKAEYELGFRDRYDAVVVNDNLDTAVGEALAKIRAFIGQK